MRQVSAFPAQQRPPWGGPTEAAGGAAGPGGSWRGKVRDFFRRPKAGQEGGPGFAEEELAEADAATVSGQLSDQQAGAAEAQVAPEPKPSGGGVHLSGKALSWPAATIPLPEGWDYDEEEEEVASREVAAQGEASTSRPAGHDSPHDTDQPHGLAMSPVARRGGIASFGSDVTEWDYPLSIQAESARTSMPATVGIPPGGHAGYDRGFSEQAAFIHQRGAGTGEAELPAAEAQAFAGQPPGMAVGQMPMYGPPLMVAPPFGGLGGMQPQWGYGQMDPAAMAAAGVGSEELERWATQQMEQWQGIVEAMRQARGSGPPPEVGGGPARASASSSACGGGRGSQRRVGTEAFAIAGADAEGSRTTVMLRNLPNDYTRDMLLNLLDEEGFNGQYNFVYLPVDFKRMAGLGYAFVNMETHECAEKIWKHFDGFKKWTLSSPKVCQVAWGEPLQGLEAHIERYRNSPVMHPDVEEMFKPVVFQNGQRTSFPAPTKRIRQPRMKYRTPVDGRAPAASVDGPVTDGAGGETASSKFVD